MGVIAIAIVCLAVDPQRGLTEFETRVQAYVDLHRALEPQTLPRTITPDMSCVLAASDALAAALVAARPNARQGDIFTPAAVAMFRARIGAALARVDVDRWLAEWYEGDDFRNLRAQVHARDPDGRVPNGLPVPLLWMLPELPPELEYRIVGRDLALWDEHAAMIVDYIPNAFPQQSFA